MTSVRPRPRTHWDFGSCRGGQPSRTTRPLRSPDSPPRLSRVGSPQLEVWGRGRAGAAGGREALVRDRQWVGIESRTWRFGDGGLLSSDTLSWPHCGTLIWPHPPSDRGRPFGFLELERRGGRRGGIERGAVRADQTGSRSRGICRSGRWRSVMVFIAGGAGRRWPRRCRRRGSVRWAGRRRSWVRIGS